MGDSLHIRQAEPGDAAVAAALLYSAYTHRQVNYPLHGDDNQGRVERLEEFFRLEGNRFSYQNIQVAVNDAGVAGLVLSFGGRDEPHLNAAVGAFLEREAADDEWYVDALAVFIDWEQRGIGTRLMNVAEQQARQRHYAKIALHVAPDNTLARNLYTRLHFEVINQATLYERPYIHMAKSVDADDMRNAGSA